MSDVLSTVFDRFMGEFGDKVGARLLIEVGEIYSTRKPDPCTPWSLGFRVAGHYPVDNYDGWMRVYRFFRVFLVTSSVALALAACGSSGATAKSGSSHSDSSSKSARNPSSSDKSGSVISSGGDFTLSRLASYTNYAFTYSATEGGTTITFTGAVHSLTDWSLRASSPDVTDYDVDGKGYSTVAGLPGITSNTFATPKGIHHLNGQYVNAEALIGMTHVTGESIRKGGSCTVAGESGTIYDLGTPSNSYFSIGDQACIASNGALLLLAQGVTGGTSAAALHLSGANEVFQVTSTGGVPPIAAP